MDKIIEEKVTTFSSKMETLNKLKNFIKEEMDVIREFIINRAAYFREISNEECEELFSINMSSPILEEFDQEDMWNHNYDLGCYNTLANVLRIIEKNEDE